MAHFVNDINSISAFGYPLSARLPEVFGGPKICPAASRPVVEISGPPGGGWIRPRRGLDRSRPGRLPAAHSEPPCPHPTARRETPPRREATAVGEGRAYGRRPPTRPRIAQEPPGWCKLGMPQANRHAWPVNWFS